MLEHTCEYIEWKEDEFGKKGLLQCGRPAATRLRTHREKHWLCKEHSEFVADAKGLTTEE